MIDSTFYILLVSVVVIIVFGYLYIRRKNKSEKEHKEMVRKNRIAIFSSMTKEEFDRSKNIFNYGTVTEEELSLLKDEESSTKPEGDL